LKAGADVSNKTVAQLISTDSKEFRMGDAKVEIAQVNVFEFNDVLTRETELKAALRAIIAEKNLDLFLFVITDILNNNSVAIALGRSTDVVEQAYNVNLVDDKALLQGVVSRKSQIVPVLTDTFTK